MDSVIDALAEVWNTNSDSSDESGAEEDIVDETG